MPSRKQDIRSQTKNTIFSVYNYLKYLVTNVPTLTVWEVFSQTQKATAEACSVSLRTVQNVTGTGNKALTCDEEESDEHRNVPQPVGFSSPRRKISHKNWITDLDEFDKDVVRRTVFEFYDRGEYPTISNLKVALNDKIGFNGSRGSLWKVLKNLGFSFKKCNDGRKFLMERSDIVSARIAFLRKMHDLRQEENPRPVIYLDETWVNQNHTRKHIWQSMDGKGGFSVPVGKGSRLILCHAGSAQHGFIDGAQLLFQSKSSCDYHQEMNHEVFNEWFINLLRGLEEGCIIVMDNASYHSTVLDRIPNSKTKKAVIVQWLSDKGIEHNPTHTVAELLTIVRQHKHRFPRRYELDEVALQMGHEVVRLPPYHCQYNPIEVKGEVAQKNTTFKIKDVRTLFENAINNVTVEDWKRCVVHAEKLQEEDFVKEGLRDEIMERIVINLQDSSESDSDTWSEGDES